MIILLAASSITLTALQASINAPREAFRICMKATSAKAADEKVTAEAYEAYIRNACSGQLGSFKGAVVRFDMGNKMSKKASDEDAEAMIADFMSSSLDHYKYMVGSTAPAKQDASAAKTSTLPPTPAAEPKP